MAVPGWLNANEGRAFPFLSQSVGRSMTGPLVLGNLPDAAIVDCGFLLGPQSGFDPLVHAVFLSRIRRLGGDFLFDFESDCPGLLGVPLTFRRAWPSAPFQTEHADSGATFGSESLSLSGSASASASLAELGTFCDVPLWSGYLITGDLAALDTFLSGDGAVGRGGGDAIVEPALVQSLAGALVTALSVANADRTRSTAAAGCDDPAPPYPTGHAFVSALCITGEVLFVAGYNASLRQDTLDQSLTIGAAVGAGAGEPCGEVPLFPDERAPAGSTLLGGGPRCNEVLRAINGAGGPLLQISAGTGVTITPDPGSHTLTINVDMTGLVTCADAVSQVSEHL